MKNVKGIASFIFTNRRIIGTVIGSTLMLFGYVDEGNFIMRVGEQ